MVYYHVQSWQRDTNGYTTGEDVLQEGSGTEMPKGNCDSNATGLTKNDYFSTYEEARTQFDKILNGYHTYCMNLNMHIDLYDKVKGEHFTFDARRN
jgi:hypothetical protein